MTNNKPDNDIETVCNFEYLSNLMGGKQDLIKKIMDTFLVQLQEELNAINNAILITDYTTIKNMAHTMKSTVSIMGISVLHPILQEMEDLGKNSTALERIIALNKQLNLICKQAFEEIKGYSFSS